MTDSADIVAFEGEAFELEGTDVVYLETLLSGYFETVRDGFIIRRMAGHSRLPSGKTLRVRSRKTSARSLLTWLAFCDPTLAALRRLRVSDRLGEHGELAALTGSIFCAELLRVAGGHGVAKNYEQRLRLSPFVRGRIDFARESRTFPGSHMTACTVWERTSETLINRWLSTATTIVSRDRVMRDACAAQLPRVRALMDGIPTLTAAERAMASPKLPHHLAHLETTLALASLLVKRTNLDEGQTTAGPSFFINLEQLFEQTVARAFQQSGVDCVAKYPVRYRQQGSEADSVRAMQVDLFCRLGSGVVVDAKYKFRVSAANLQQAVTYCFMTGASRAVLVFPAGSQETARYTLQSPQGPRYIVEAVNLRTDANSIEDWRQFGKELVAQVLVLGGESTAPKVNGVVPQTDQADC